MAEAKPDTIAVVDDDRAVRDSLRFLLETVGHKVETFVGATDFLRAEFRRVACLLLDHHMPGMTGLEPAEHLNAAGVTIPILLITGAPSPAIVARAAKLGITRVLEKPPDEDDILTFIDAAML